MGSSSGSPAHMDCEAQQCLYRVQLLRIIQSTTYRCSRMANTPWDLLCISNCHSHIPLLLPSKDSLPDNHGRQRNGDNNGHAGRKELQSIRTEALSGLRKVGGVRPEHNLSLRAIAIGNSIVAFGHIDCDAYSTMALAVDVK